MPEVPTRAGPPAFRPGEVVESLVKSPASRYPTGVKRNRREKSPSDLEPLAALAEDYARYMMKTSGSVPPTVIADTAEGFVFCMPNALTHEAAKDRFAEVAKLFAIAHRARSLVLVAEAWAALPDANGHLDTETPPSQSATRKEVVVLMVEDSSTQATRLLPILRDPAGGFVDFADPGPLHAGEAAGRFAGLMPGHQPSAREVAQAKATLIELGLEIINRGFDPSMN